MKSKDKSKEAALSIDEKLKAALVPEADQPYSIPENWVWSKLGSLVNIKYGKGLKQEIRKDGDYPVYGSNGIVGFHDEPLTKGQTIIIGRKGSVGEVHHSTNKCWPIDTTYYIDDLHLIDYPFLSYLLGNLRLRQLDKSTAIPGINRNELYAVNVPLPPLPEQQRIAEKLESLLGKIKEAKALMDEIPDILQNFRQTVLAAACSGRLTKDWRKENPNEKSSFVTQRQTQGRQIFEIPRTWALVTVKDVSTKIEYGYTASSNKSPVGPKLLRITDIQDGKVNWEDVPYCEIEVKKKKRFLLTPGDIVFARTGATTGKSFLIVECPEAVFASYLIRIKPVDEMIPEYMYFFFQSEFYWEQIYENISGIAQPNCNASKLSSLNIPLPPLPEQHEIVRRVESLFRKADDLEAQYKEAMDNIEILPEIILSKAFRGELLPQDLNDEPASVLLKRIIESFDKKEPIEIFVEEVVVVKDKVTIKKRIPLFDALKEANDWLSASDLLHKAGYPRDADPDTIEDFYLQLKRELKSSPPRIERERRKENDYFRHFDRL